MGPLILIYMLLVLLTGVPAFFKLGLWLGLCGTFSPLLAQIAAGAIAQVLRDRPAYAWGTIIIGLVMTALSLWWVSRMGWHLTIFGHDMPGVVENLIGVGVGAVFGLCWRPEQAAGNGSVAVEQ